MFMLNSYITAQIPCAGNLITNDDFSLGLTNWSQYGTMPNAIVLNATNGCLNNFLALPTFTNSNVGVSQAIVLQKDSCYQLCYCVEFPGGTFNSKLTIAAIMPGVSVSQLLSGTYTPGQAQIIDIISSSNSISPNYRCPMSFMSNGNFTDIVIVNETIGLYGSDVRIDNVCLTQHPCTAGCGNEKANFIYSYAGGYNVNFSDISSYTPGNILSWSWNFGDPPSGPNNTSNLQNPTHTFSGPGTYTVCMKFTAITNFGILCQDSICINVTLQMLTNIKNIPTIELTIFPVPASDYLQINGDFGFALLELFNTSGIRVYKTDITSEMVPLPLLSNGIYFAKIVTEKETIVRKILINR